MADPSATPLSNADFRKLLETPRSERGGGPSETPRRPGGGGGGGDKDKKQHKPHKPGAKPGAKPAKKKEGEEEEDEDSIKYRRVEGPLLGQRVTGGASIQIS
jgi:IK cytokine